MNGISTQDIEALMALFERTEWKVMHLTLGDFDLFLSKDGSGADLLGAPPAPSSPRAAAAATSAPAAVQPAKPPVGKGAPEVPAGWTLVKAPSLGTFYRAAKPGAAAFTQLGARVAKDAELCLIEVMKLFTTLRAPAAGVVREIYASDGELVEYDQPLFLIEPDA